jgi:hypothetical protein
MEKVGDKLTIGAANCCVRESASGFYLENIGNSNKLVFQQFGLTREFLCELSRTCIKGGVGSFPYHATLPDLSQTIKLLKVIEKLGNNWRDNLVIWKLTPSNHPKYDLIVEDRVSSKQFILFNYGLCMKSNVTEGRLEFVQRKPVEEDVYPPGTKLVGVTRTGNNITVFNDVDQGFFLADRSVRERELNTGKSLVKIWDKHGFLLCFEEDLKVWEDPEAALPSNNVFDVVALTARRDELLEMEVVNRLDIAKVWADNALSDEIGHFSTANRIGKPMLWGTGGSDTSHHFDSFRASPSLAVEIPVFMKHYPLMPSEAFKVKPKTVLVSPIKIKKRPLI